MFISSYAELNYFAHIAGGLIVDGPLLNVSCCSSGYGRAPITHIHGMIMLSELDNLVSSIFDIL